MLDDRDAAIAWFRREHPEYDHLIRDDFGAVGPLMKTEAILAFVAWSVEKGLTTKAKADKFKRTMRMARQIGKANKHESN